MAEYLILHLIAAVPALLLAFWRDKKLHQRKSDAMGFRWGYFTGFRILIVGIILLPLLAIARASGDLAADETLGCLFLVVVFLIVPGVFISLRHRWAWVMYTACSMNPVLWIINGSYIKHRWKEIRDDRASGQVGSTPPIRPPSGPPPTITPQALPTGQKFACPHCQRHLEAPEELLGTTVDCPSCQGQIQLPPPSKAEPAPPPLTITNAQVRATSWDVPANSGAAAPPGKRRMHGCLLAFLIALGLVVIGVPLGIYVGGKAFMDYAKDKMESSPLCVAVAVGKIDDVDLLLSQGEDPNQKGPMGHSPLIMATDHDYPLIAERLLKAGADPNQKDNLGWSPLHHAVKTQHAALDLITILVRYRADPNVTDNHLRTPLHRAAQFGHVDAVRLLLRLGADPNATDENGWTPLDRGAVHPAVRQILGGE